LSGSEEEDEGEEDEEGVEGDGDEHGRRVVLDGDILVHEVEVLDGLNAARKAARNLKKKGIRVARFFLVPKLEKIHQNIHQIPNGHKIYQNGNINTK
jgi:hypothetical protein